MEILIIALIIFVVLGGLLIFAGYRSREADRALGRLGRKARREHRRQARVDRILSDETAAPLSGREVEEQALMIRRQGEIQETPSGQLAEVEWVPPDPETIGVTRRQFLNRSIVGTMALSISGFGGAMLAFLWPSGASGFGAKINVGAVDDVKQQVRENNGFLYVSEGRMWITEYPEGSLEKARQIYSSPELAGMEAGLLALYQKCPHLGCRVPECVPSQWFECPCHGSQYSRVGEKRGGPAPRGMDRFAMSVNSRGDFVVDTGTIIQGPPIGTNTTGQEAEGPHCIGESSE